MTAARTTPLAAVLLLACAACVDDRAEAVAPARQVDAQAQVEAAAGAVDGDDAGGRDADAVGVDTAALVGSEVPPWPDGLRELSGTCVSPSDDPAQVCSHGIAVVGRMPADADASAVPVLVAATRSLGRDGGLPRWRVTDVLPHPQAGDGDYVQSATCRVGGVDDGGVVALVGDDAEAERLPARWARRLDFASGRFAEIDPATVDCLNEGHGL